eukprot:11175548-Lingulodinium_polyedra.AAC.1
MPQEINARLRDINAPERCCQLGIPEQPAGRSLQAAHQALSPIIAGQALNVMPELRLPRIGAL